MIYTQQTSVPSGMWQEYARRRTQHTLNCSSTTQLQRGHRCRRRGYATVSQHVDALKLEAAVGRQSQILRFSLPAQAGTHVRVSIISERQQHLTVTQSP
jgi:hypothetical protein